MNRRFGKNDIILALILIVVALGGLCFYFFGNKNPGSLVQIMVDGKLYGTYSLDETISVDILNEDGKVTNVLKIENHKADMTEADCPDKLCVYQHAISSAGENIVCLPNKVIATVLNDKEEEFDAISK